MVLTDRRRASAAAGHDDDAIAMTAAAIDRLDLREVEVMWVDHQGHARGKRIDAGSFLARASLASRSVTPRWRGISPAT
jgi:hypothetical protein